jgi:uncharacterized protein
VVLRILPPDSTADDLAAFERTCERWAGFDDRISAEWVDGALTAWAAGPVRPEGEAWLDTLAGDGFARCFADPADAQAARAALQARLGVLLAQLDAEALLDAPDALRLRPLMYAWDDEARAQAVTDGVVTQEEAAQLASGQEWVDGFLTVVEAEGSPWQAADAVDGEDQEAFEALLSEVAAVSFPDGSEALREHLARQDPDALPSRDDLIDQACFAVQDLRVWWLDHAPRPATRRVEATPGRNDPCPCGSGRKYKKCHGA